MDEYFAALKQYANFNGRAGRKEYWRFFAGANRHCLCAGGLAGGKVSRAVGQREQPARFALARFGRGKAAVCRDGAVCAGNFFAHLRHQRVPSARQRLFGLVAAAGADSLCGRADIVCAALP